MQLLVIAGNVGKDAVLRQAGQDDVLNFPLAVSNGKDASGADRPATWYECAIWGKRARSLETHITKGLKLTVSGRPTVRVHDGKAYLGITVQDLTFGGSSGNGGSRSAQRDNHDSGYQAPPRDNLNDDIPF